MKKVLLKWNLEGELNGVVIKEVEYSYSYEESLKSFKERHEGIVNCSVTGDFENIDKI